MACPRHGSVTGVEATPFQCDGFFCQQDIDGDNDIKLFFYPPAVNDPMIRTWQGYLTENFTADAAACFLLLRQALFQSEQV